MRLDGSLLPTASQVEHPPSQVLAYKGETAGFWDSLVFLSWRLQHGVIAIFLNAVNKREKQRHHTKKGFSQRRLLVCQESIQNFKLCDESGRSYLLQDEATGVKTLDENPSLVSD